MLKKARKSKYLAVRSAKIIEYITNYREMHDYGPSLNEICAHIGIKSTSLVSYYIHKLEEEGYIKRDPKISRSIRAIKQLS